MSCQGLEEDLSAYIDDELTPQEKESLEQHLATCDSCRSVLSELRAVKEAMQSVPEEELPLGLHESIMMSVASHPRSFSERVRLHLSGWTYRQWVSAVAAAMVLVIFVSAGGGMWYANHKQNVSPLLDTANTSEGYGGGAMARSSPPATYGAESPAPETSGSTNDTALTSKSLMMAADAQSAAGAGAVLVSTDQKIIKRAQLSIEVARGKVRETSELAVNAVKANMGYVESSSMSQSENDEKEFTNFYMVARVPAESLDPVMDQLAALGNTTREDTSSQDVTDAYVDLDARLRNKQNEEQRLLTIMGEAETVGELLQVEGELSRVRGDIESMTAQKQNYDKQVSLSTVSFTLSEEGAVKTYPSPWSDVWRTFVNAWQTLFILAAKVGPTLIVLAVLYGAIMIALRHRRPAA